MQERRIVFLGSDVLAIPLLESLLKDSNPELGRLVGIVTQPDKARGRGKKLQPAVLKEFADQHQIPCMQPEKWTAQTLEDLKAWEPDVLLVLAYGHILKQSVLDLAPFGAWNFHASLLPALRGSSPIETAVAEGCKETGMTLMRMVRKLDAGPIVGCERVAIETEDTGPDIRHKLAQTCVPLWQKWGHAILEGKVNEQPQDENQVSYCRILDKCDGWIDFTKEPEFWVRRARAFIVWPGLSFELNGERFKVEDLRREEISNPGESVEAGTVLESRDSLRVACGTGILTIGCLQKPGGRMLAAADFLRGYPIQAGTQLTGFQAQPLVSLKPFRFSK